MSSIISPFQMKKNKVVSYSIEQIEEMQEYESTNVTFGADFIISDIINQDGLLNARVDLLIGLEGKTNNQEIVFKIQLDMMGIFEGDCELIDEKKFMNMLEINGISTLMQLSRSYVTATTALSGFTNPINFPMVNVFELINSKKKI